MLVLYELQQADSAIRQLERELAALDDGSAARARADQAKAEAERTAARQKDLEKELLAAELLLKSKEAKKKDCESKMYGGRIGNPKELEDLQREVTSLAAAIDRLSDEALGLMDRLETARTEAKQAAAVATAEEAEATRVAEQQQAARVRLKSALAEREAARKEIAGRADPALLRRYEDLRARKGGVAVAAVQGAMCTACRTSLPVDVLRRVSAAQDVVPCDNCLRMLVDVAEPAA